MEKKDMTRIGVGVAILLVLAVLGSFVLRILASDTPDLVLPATSVAGSDFDGEDDPFEGNVLRVDVTADTVQNVITTLSRPDSYAQEISLETFWPDENESGGQASAVTQSKVWVNQGYARIDLTLPSGRSVHRIVAGDMVYLWADGERDYAALPADERSADLEQRIPTYEDVLEIPLAEIADAGYQQKNAVNCIYVEVKASPMGYEEKYWISVETGLLAAAETWDADRLIYQMRQDRISVPGEGGAFFLPDGTPVGPEES